MEDRTDLQNILQGSKVIFYFPQTFVTLRRIIARKLGAGRQNKLPIETLFLLQLLLTHLDRILLYLKYLG